MEEELLRFSNLIIKIKKTDLAKNKKECNTNPLTNWKLKNKYRENTKLWKYLYEHNALLRVKAEICI